MPTSIPRRRLIKKLRSFGFDGPFSGGKHQFMINGQIKLRIPNPHKKKDINQSLVNEILKQAGININQWDDA